MREDPNRRNVMATGVALALAAPMSTLTAASVSADIGEDWPEFAEWVSVIHEVDKECAANRHGKRMLEEQRASDDRVDALIDKAHLLEVAMEKRPVFTDRHFTMLMTIAIWQMETPSAENSFDVTGMEIPGGDLTHGFIARCVARFAQHVPEVPFVFPAA